MSREAYKQGYDQIDWKPLPAPERPARDTSKRADFPIPMMIRDFDEPVQSMANGRWYHSKRGLAASHKASGNPHGQDFIELGNDKPLPFVPHKTDERAEREVIRQAVHDVENGWVPPAPVALD
jgi:hypothetical protein